MNLIRTPKMTDAKRSVHRPVSNSYFMKYRKKPIVIEAFQMTEQRRKDNRDWPGWLHEAWQKDIEECGSLVPEDYPQSFGNDRLCIATLEGRMVIGWGDWIIKGVEGELYPCKQSIFEATYDRVAGPGDCKYCKGSGYPFDGEHKWKCPKCKGTGKVSDISANVKMSCDPL